MHKKIADLVHRNPVTLDCSQSAHDAARLMREHNIGDVVITEGGNVKGIVTDRDIVVNCLAVDKDPKSTTLRDFCGSKVVSIAPSESLNEAVQRMRQNSIRRLVVCEGDELVGVLSLGDLAVTLDPDSALGQISQAPANN